MMGPRDWFGVGVRLLGVAALTRGVGYVSSFAYVKLGFETKPNPDPASGYLLSAVFDFALAAFFLLWTRHLVEWSYGDGQSREPKSPADGLGAEEIR